jgi:hypothetical protein
MSGDEYGKAMKALARDVRMDPATAARIEQDLVSVMASRGAAQPPSSPDMEHAPWHPPVAGKRISVTWHPWLPAAAAIVLVVGSVFAWRLNRPLVIVEKRAVPSPSSQATPAIPPHTIDHDAVPLTVSASHPARHVPIGKASPKVNVVKPSGFVELPWSAGLPAFESGEIVRMEVPVASLPAYGIDISSGGGRPVEADILIGQDGLARAVRLVTNSARSVQ